ncbi:MAG: metalloregulator ArsR/SmtB family transcription factor [Candidatus Ancaeobacter aquaticus]|nr:metalloregulator ArsR/SmtB family transcription factor [Candidatus Ancaeobacter aquaticus]
MNYEKKSELLKALGHPVRLRIACGLLKHECNVNKIVDSLGLPQSTVSQHLGILRSQGIIHSHKDGVRTCYKVIDKNIKKLLRVIESEVDV